MPIYVIRAGQPKLVTRVYQAVNTNVASVLPKEVLLVELVAAPVPGTKTPVLKVVHDRYQYPPVNLRGVTATHTSGTLAWSVPTQGGTPSEYQVTYKGRKAGTTTYGTPVVLSWTGQTSQAVTGLAPSMEYVFTVVARRQATDGSYLVSPPSAALTLATNQASILKQNPAWPGDNLVYIPATRSDTWTNDWFWGPKSGGPDVIQGYFRTRSLNGYGVVLYSNVRGRAATAVNALDTAGGLAVDMTKVSTDDAKIDSIFRKPGGSGRPAIHLYPCQINFSSNAHPVAFGGVAAGTIFTAPAEGTAVDELDPGKLLTWAREWMSTAPDHNGLLMYRTDGDGNATAGYDGYAVLRAADLSAATSIPADWRLKLWLKWSYTIPDVPPVWR